MAFVHLHTHSEYSLLDGANRIPELVSHVKRMGMDSLAVTDHGNLHAAWSFYDEAKKQGIRPILGFEAYLAFGPRQAARGRPAPVPVRDDRHVPGRRQLSHQLCQSWKSTEDARRGESGSPSRRSGVVPPRRGTRLPAGPRPR